MGSLPFVKYDTKSSFRPVLKLLSCLPVKAYFDTFSVVHADLSAHLIDGRADCIRAS